MTRTTSTPSTIGGRGTHRIPAPNPKTPPVPGAKIDSQGVWRDPSGRGWLDDDQVAELDRREAVVQEAQHVQEARQRRDDVLAGRRPRMTPREAMNAKLRGELPDVIHLDELDLRTSAETVADIWQAKFDEAAEQYDRADPVASSKWARADARRVAGELNRAIDAGDITGDDAVAALDVQHHAWRHIALLGRAAPDDPAGRAALMEELGLRPGHQDDEPIMAQLSMDAYMDVEAGLPMPSNTHGWTPPGSIERRRAEADQRDLWYRRQEELQAEVDAARTERDRLANAEAALEQHQRTPPSRPEGAMRSAAEYQTTLVEELAEAAPQRQG